MRRIKYASQGHLLGDALKKTSIKDKLLQLLKITVRIPVKDVTELKRIRQLKTPNPYSDYINNLYDTHIINYRQQ